MTSFPEHNGIDAGSNPRRRASARLVTCIILVACAGCQTFNLSEDDFRRQQEGKTVDKEVGDAMGVAGTLGYYGAMIGSAVAAAGGK